MKYLLLDSNIVIDYLAADSKIFFLISERLGEPTFADAMIHEIMEFGVDGDLSHYGLSKVFVPAEDLDAAKRNAEHGKLSEEDWICLLTAKRRGYCCVTNDERLRRRCESENIPTIRGHRLILDLCAEGGISVEYARVVGDKIFDKNPYKKASIIEDFHRSLADLARKLGQEPPKEANE